MSRAYTEGDYYIAIHYTKNCDMYFVYYRVLQALDPATGHVVFVDQDGTRVGMLPRYAEDMRRVSEGEEHPEINTSHWTA